MAGGSSRGPWIFGVVAAVAAIAFMGVGLLRPPGNLGDVFLEPAGAEGTDPFMVLDGNADLRAGLDNTLELSGDVTLRIGTEPGLYGGSGSDNFCDPSLIADFLEGDRAKAKAWANIAGIPIDDIHGYLEGLAPVRLLTDTLITNHGFDGLSAVPRQAVLQQGTIVLVDDLGVPRVRCKCGNPLAPPEFDTVDNTDLIGRTWDRFESGSVTVIQAGGEPVDKFILTNLDSEGFTARPVGTSGDEDKPVDIDGTPTEPEAKPVEDLDSQEQVEAVSPLRAQELCQDNGPAEVGFITGIADSIEMRNAPGGSTPEISRLSAESPVTYFLESIVETQNYIPWVQVAAGDSCGWVKSANVKGPDGAVLTIPDFDDYLERVVNNLEPEATHGTLVPIGLDGDGIMEWEPFDDSELLQAEANLRRLFAENGPLTVIPIEEATGTDDKIGCAIGDAGYYCEMNLFNSSGDFVAKIQTSQTTGFTNLLITEP